MTSGHSSVFPLVKHAHRTSGFFFFQDLRHQRHSTIWKFEDFIFRNVDISDFKAELITERDPRYNATVG